MRRPGVSGRRLTDWLAAAAIAGAVAALYVVAELGERSTLGSIALAGLALIGLAAAAALAMRPGLGQGQSSWTRMLGRAVEEGPDAVAIADGAGRVAHASAAFHDLVERDLGRSALALSSALGGVADDVFERLAADARASRLASREVEITDRDGRARCLSVTARPESGDSDWIVWRIEDVSEQRDREHRSTRERTWLSAFVEDAPLGCYEIDAAGRFRFVNRTMATWLGRAAQDLVDGGVRLADVIVDREHGTGEASAGAADPLGGAALGRVTMLGRNGHTFEAEISHNRIPSGDAGAGGICGTVRDLSQERALQGALQQAEERFRRFFDFAPVGVVTVDREARVTEVNAAFRAMIGRDGEGAVTRSASGLVSREDRGEIDALLDSVFGGKPTAGPVEVRLSGDAGRVAGLYASPVAASDNSVSGAVLYFIDATEQKNLEVQFAQSQKMQAVGQLAGGVAHDFNNLLTAMIGFCDLLLLRHQAGDESFSDIMQIKQNANRAANLVRQLLAFSRQLTLRPKVLDITDVLSELSHLLRRLIGETIELKVVHGRDLGLVKVDHGQLEQVIINLAVNARDAMPDGGTLTIRTANVTAEESTRLGHELMPPGDYVLIETADTGTGIPAEHLGKVFEPFFTTKGVGAGTGLGLSTVYGIVKQTGGYVFPSNLPEGGACFRIYLPRHNVEAGAVKAEGETEPQAARDLTGKGVVLLVEDEDAVRTFAARALRNKGYTVLEAESGESALKVVNGHEGAIDLLISDVVMPQMDGPTLVKHVRVSSPDTKIIFISGYAEDAFRRNLDSNTRDFMFLPKPFSLTQLAGKVKEVLASDRI